MFTGLVQDSGCIKDISELQGGRIFAVEVHFDTEKIKKGDSIAINGACQSVIKKENNTLYFEAMNETLRLTNLASIKKGDFVNVELAMKLSDRLDGHLVSGHIDRVAKLNSIKNDGAARIFNFECDTDLIVKKGSISVNGISLTVSEVNEKNFEVSILPETFNNTNLKYLKINDVVNIEYDMVAKYIKKFTEQKKESKITKEFLIENGF